MYGFLLLASCGLSEFLLLRLAHLLCSVSLLLAALYDLGLAQLLRLCVYPLLLKALALKVYKPELAIGPVVCELLWRWAPFLDAART